MAKKVTRRTVLRGVAGGLGASVALPFLDCFLDGNGVAFAGTRNPLPTVFGTWFQHLGMNPGRWEPLGVGRDFRMNHEMKVFERFKSRMNVFSGMEYFVEGRPLETHTTGGQIATLGHIPYGNESGPSIDSIVADHIGTRTRFRSIEMSLSGSRRSLSKRSGRAVNPSEGSPAALYARLFGDGFVDPNGGEFAPDPQVMARRSVLSLVADQRNELIRTVGAADRVRLDEYFTAIREIEQQLDLELQPPAPLQACVRPQPIEETPTGTEVDVAERNAMLFGKLLAAALACGQSRVFNVTVDSMGLRRPGSSQGWHMLTHEEPVDPRLGYQVQSTWFINWANEVFARFLGELENVREGDHRLLDRVLVVWHTDHGDARVHSMNNIPVMTVGSGNGRLKTGYHISAPGDPVTRVGLTVQQALGVPVNTWGERGNGTDRTITEIMA